MPSHAYKKENWTKNPKSNWWRQISVINVNEISKLFDNNTNRLIHHTNKISWITLNIPMLKIPIHKSFMQIFCIVFHCLGAWYRVWFTSIVFDANSGNNIISLSFTLEWIYCKISQATLYNFEIN